MEPRSGGDSEPSLSIGQMAMSSCCGAVVTSFFMTPFDVIKVRLQQQQFPSSKRLQKRRYWSLPSATIRGLEMTPLDVVKIRLQQQGHPITNNRCFLYCNGLMDHLCTCTTWSVGNDRSCPWFNRPGRFVGTMDAFVKIARHEGLKSLWSGLSPTLVMAVPATVFYFSVYDSVLSKLRCHFDQRYRFLAPMLSGATARVLAVSLVSPLEMVRTKLQSERLTYRALYWPCYEWLKRSLISQFGYSQTTIPISFLSGALAGSLAAMLTLPFDVVKTHRQIAIGEIEFSKTNSQSSSTWMLMRNLVKNGGFSALYSGW